MSLLGAVQRLQTHAGACSGVKHAPAKAPDSATAYPFAVSYPELGELNSEAYNDTRALHTIITEFHAAAVMTGDAIDKVMPIMEEFHRRVKLDETLNGEISNIVWPITYQFGRLEWAKVETIGVRFHIPVKIRGIAST